MFHQLSLELLLVAGTAYHLCCVKPVGLYSLKHLLVLLVQPQAAVIWFPSLPKVGGERCMVRGGLLVAMVQSQKDMHCETACDTLEDAHGLKMLKLSESLQRRWGV